MATRGTRRAAERRLELHEDPPRNANGTPPGLVWNCLAPPGRKQRARALTRVLLGIEKRVKTVETHSEADDKTRDNRENRAI